VQVATLLLAAGASVNRAGDQGYTPLLDAVRGDYTEATSVFIAAGGDVNYTMASAARTHGASRTPSFAAVFYAHVHMVDRLIAAGVDISMPCCSSSRTVLYFAFPYRYHNPEIVQQLRAAGDP
jgi:ankyrin repeat protein